MDGREGALIEEIHDVDRRTGTGSVHRNANWYPHWSWNWERFRDRDALRDRPNSKRLGHRNSNSEVLWDGKAKGMWSSFAGQAATPAAAGGVSYCQKAGDGNYSQHISQVSEEA